MNPAPSLRGTARVAGLLYLVIIVCGVGGEGLVRAPLHADDAGQTVANLLAAEGAFRVSLLADVAMALSDVGLGVLLFWLLRPINPVLSLAAAAFRLAQASILGLNLVNLDAALRLAHTEALPAETRSALVAAALEAHAAGYDLGLFFFAVNCAITGALLFRSAVVPRAMGILLGAAGIVYLGGSTVRLVAPDLSALVAPAYAVPLLAELAFCVWLLLWGARLERSAEGRGA